MKCYAYTLRGGDVLFVPVDAPVVRYTPTISTEDQVELDTVAALFGGLANVGEVDLPSTRTPKTKRRKQRHPRTPKKWWKRRRLVMALGTAAAGKKLGLGTEVLSTMANYYGWRYPKFKRGPKATPTTEASNG